MFFANSYILILTFFDTKATLYAKWTRNDVTLATPTREGYTFKGWFTAASGGTQITSSTTIDKNQTIYAQWIANTYTANYNANGGTGTMTSDTATYNANYTTKSNAFSKTGYTFAGWNEKADGTGTSWTNWIGKPWQWTYTNNITLYAQWTPNTYTVSYNANGGTGTMTSDTATYNANYTTKSNAFSKTGYTFAGWNEKADGTGTSWTNWIGKPWQWTYTNNITLYAQWTPNTYTVSYNANGGTGTMTSDTATYNANYTTKSNAFSKTGYTFAGWNEKADGTGTNWTDWIGKPWKWIYTNNITLYAQWKPNTYKISYDVNFFPKDLWQYTSVAEKYIDHRTITKSKTTIADSSVKYGEIAKFTMGAGTNGGVYYPVDTKLTSGKTYTWSMYIKTSKPKKILTGQEQNGYLNIETTTQWKKITHTFTANNNGSYAFIFYLRDGEVWNDGDELYVHSLEIMEGTPGVTTVNLPYGSTLGKLSTPSRTGHTFKGWYTAPQGGTQVTASTPVPAGNTTYYAQWTATTKYGYKRSTTDLWSDTSNPNKYTAFKVTVKSRSNIANSSVKNGQIVKLVLSAGGGGVYYTPSAKLTNGKTYICSFYLKAPKGRALTVGPEQTSQMWIDGTGDWQKVDLAFKAVENPYGNYSFIIYTLNDAQWSNNDELYIHSLKIVEATLGTK